MSQFEGNKLKVRCIDCEHFQYGNVCGAKGSKVAPKKKRLCSSYSFTGEYFNRVPAASIYTPHVDQNTKQLIKKLAKLGVVPIDSEEVANPEDGYELKKVLPMPASTATANQIVQTPVQDVPSEADEPIGPGPGDLAG